VRCPACTSFMMSASRPGSKQTLFVPSAECHSSEGRRKKRKERKNENENEEKERKTFFLPRIGSHHHGSLHTEVKGAEFVLNIIACGGGRILGQGGLVGKGPKWLENLVRGDVPEEGGRDPPQWPALLLGLCGSLQGAVIDHDLMVASLDGATSEPLDLLASLNKEATVWHPHGNLLSVLVPHIEAWVA